MARLKAAISQKEQETLVEMKSNSSILQEMSWTGTTGDPVAFLSRVADLAQGSRLRVLAVGPLEQQDTPQFSKSWHAITVQGPFQDLVDLATRVENDRGTLENVSMESQTPPPPAPVAGRPAPSARVTPEVLARFRVTALQLTQQARRIINDAANASGVPLAAPGPQAGLSLPVPSAAAESRDPFSFGPSVERPREAESAAPKQAFDLQGFVGFPDGHLATPSSTSPTPCWCCVSPTARHAVSRFPRSGRPGPWPLREDHQSLARRRRERVRPRFAPPCHEIPVIPKISPSRDARLSREGSQS